MCIFLYFFVTFCLEPTRINTGLSIKLTKNQKIIEQNLHFIALSGRPIYFNALILVNIHCHTHTKRNELCLRKLHWLQGLLAELDFK